MPEMLLKLGGKTYDGGLMALEPIHEGWRVEDPRFKGKYVCIWADVHAKLLLKELDCQEPVNAVIAHLNAPAYSPTVHI